MQFVRGLIRGSVYLGVFVFIAGLPGVLVAGAGASGKGLFAYDASQFAEMMKAFLVGNLLGYGLIPFCWILPFIAIGAVCLLDKATTEKPDGVGDNEMLDAEVARERRLAEAAKLAR